VNAPVGLKADIVDEGQEAFVIETPAATYCYHKEGGGFSSLIDGDGRDWISYRPGDGPAGEYRGIPNMVFRGADRGYLHPGHTGTKGSSTELLEDCPGAISLQTTSGDGKWQVRWDVFAAFARMRVLRTDRDDPDYWFLYEGTPGGDFDPDASLCVRCTGESEPLSRSWEVDLPSPAWVAFTDPQHRQCLVLRSDVAGTAPVMYKPMPPMTVFGFGRHLEGVQAFLGDADAVFYVGLVDAMAPDALAAEVMSWE